jgi:uracil-DNA glycosylase family 4
MKEIDDRKMMIDGEGTFVDVGGWADLNDEIVACRRCPRLLEHCTEMARIKRAAYLDWEYWGKPVPNFGDPHGRLLMVGLAPGAHGSNRTGRMFTGDRSGEFLFRALYETGFANQPDGRHPDDGLQLHDIAITAAAHCAPPGNLPLADEMASCAEYLTRTFDVMKNLRGVIALGKIGFDAVIRFYLEQGWIPNKRGLRFAHGALYAFENAPFILCTYHPSQQNTFTGRLTMEMLVEVFRRGREVLS